MLKEAYNIQKERWPNTGRHILAQFDDENIVVYQAYCPAIGLYAAEHGRLGGEFKFSRMSWIKPNFLWMMYRSGWGTKQWQEITLAFTIPRTLFDEMLESAVPSSYVATLYRDKASWKQAVAGSDVRLQWDPDHAPNGAPQERRAIQIGLRGGMLRRFAAEEVVAIEDVSAFVAEQRHRVQTGGELLETPREEVYLPKSLEARSNVGLD